VQRIPSHSELVRLAANDPWIRWGLPASLPKEVWSDGQVALIRRLSTRPGFWVTPLHGTASAPQLRSALEWLVGSGELDALETVSVSVPREHLAVAEEVLDLADGGDWDWMWTTTPPPRDPREADLVELDDAADADEIGRFTYRNNPRVWTEIGTGRMKKWLGLRGPDGDLIGVGGAEWEDSGVPHLAGIVTERARRGEGIGEVITAGLTRWSIAEYGVCTLGVFSDNTVALRLYARLGYRTARAWASRRVSR